MSDNCFATCDDLFNEGELDEDGWNDCIGDCYDDPAYYEEEEEW